MRVLVWTRPAANDRKRIFEYVASEYREAAVKLDLRLQEQARTLLKQPHLGRPGRVQGTREFVVHANYLIVYAVTPSTITVVRVVHARQQWPVE